MIKTLLLSLALLFSFGASAQNATYKYLFPGDLKEANAKAPALSDQCPGMYVSESLPVGVTRKVYAFNKGCGLVYHDSAKKFIAAGTYTIELYFRLDTISGYKKLIDFDSLGADAGLYVQNGNLSLYPGFTSADSFVGAGSYHYVALTRDATTKRMYINANGKTAGTTTDNSNLYKLGLDSILTFFRDDMGTGAEQSKGAVAMIQISNYALDSNSIKTNYTRLNKTLSVPTLSQQGIQLYPNPTTDKLQLSLSTPCSYSICDLSGRSVSSGILQAGDNHIPVAQLSNGLYLLKLLSFNNTDQQVLRFTKQ